MKTYTTLYKTREEAEVEYDTYRGEPGYSEAYPSSIFETTNTENEPRWAITWREYFG